MQRGDDFARIRLETLTTSAANVGDIFTETVALTTAAASELVGMDIRMQSLRGRGSNEKAHACKDFAGTWILRATKKGPDNIWTISYTKEEHVDCLGGGRTPPAVIKPLMSSRLLQLTTKYQ